VSRYVARNSATRPLPAFSTTSLPPLPSFPFPLLPFPTPPEVEWVEVLLAYASPPLYAQVDGEAYGVYEIRSYEDLHARNAAVTAAGEAAEAAEAARRALEAAEEEGSTGEPRLR